MTTTTSRRAVLAGAAAIATTPALAMPATADVELIRLGAQLEPLLLQYLDETVKWAPLLRAAHREVNSAHWSLRYGDLSIKQRRAYARMLDEATIRNGCQAAENGMQEIYERMEPIAEAITEAQATSLGGLRAKALMWLFEVRPAFADDFGHLNFSDEDGGVSRSMFYAIANLTGLSTTVVEIEGRLQACADSIARAGKAVQS